MLGTILRGKASQAFRFIVCELPVQLPSARPGPKADGNDVGIGALPQPGRAVSLHRCRVGSAGRAGMPVWHFSPAGHGSGPATHIVQRASSRCQGRKLPTSMEWSGCRMGNAMIPRMHAGWGACIARRHTDEQKAHGRVQSVERQLASWSAWVMLPGLWGVSALFLARL